MLPISSIIAHDPEILLTTPLTSAFVATTETDLKQPKDKIKKKS